MFNNSFYHISFEPFSNLLSWPSSYMNGAQSSECIISPGKQFMSKFLDSALTFWFGKHLSFLWLFWRCSKGFWHQGSMNTFGWGSGPWYCTCLCCPSAQKIPRQRWDWAEHPGEARGQACHGLVTIRVFPLQFNWIKTPSLFKITISDRGDHPWN